MESEAVCGEGDAVGASDHASVPTARSDNPDRPDTQETALTPRFLGPRLEGLRFLVLGTCQVGYISVFAHELGYTADHVLYDSKPFADIPKVDLPSYDAVVVGLTFRHLIDEASSGAGELAYIRTTDPDEAAAILNATIAIMRDRVADLHERYKSKPTFFQSFQEPSFNYLGNLTERFAPGTTKYFMRTLNMALEECLRQHVNFHLLEASEGLATIGTMHLHDDVFMHWPHASLIGNFDEQFDGTRIVPLVPMFTTYDTERQMRRSAHLMLNMLADNVKIIRQIDSVKLIICDLDDTMWRGIAAEETVPNWFRIEGWPFGFVEALLLYKRRGGLLAISSKNDHDDTIRRFKEIWGNYILIEDFASVKINWEPKSAGIAEILAETNILAQNALFIDDNPREIDEVRAQHPDLRGMGGNHYDWRRIILRSPETQVPFISNESQQRTQLVKARIDREVSAKTMSRAEWLESLAIQATVATVDDTADPQFARAMELINKTNQFNTTGKRWELGELEALFGEGGACLLVSIKDKTVDNGIIGVALVKPGEIVQAVLSCRVFGLGAETVMGRAATMLALQGKPFVTARIHDTGRNFACHNFFTDIGFAHDGDDFVALSPCAAPAWIEVTMPEIITAPREAEAEVDAMTESAPESVAVDAVTPVGGWRAAMNSVFGKPND